MATNYPFIAGEGLPADEVNQVMRAIGIQSFTVTYNDNDQIDTIEDTDSGVIFTFSYNDNDQIEEITDGTNTWTLAYNDNDQVESMVRT